MLSIAVVQEIRRLLDERQLSQRSIALKLGVSRGIVSNMASGRRAVFGREPDQRPDRVSLKRETSLPIRCRSCGGLVHAPCRLCEARELRRRTMLLRRLLAEHQEARRRRVA